MSGRPRGEGLGIPSPHFGCYTASPGRYTNTGCRVVLVSLYGPLYLTVTCSLFSLFDSGYFLRQSTSASVGTETDTHSATVLVSGDSTVAVPGQGVLAHRCATTGAGPFLDLSVVAQRQFPMVQLFLLKVQFSDKVAVMPVVGQRQVPQFRSCSFTVVDTPVVAQWLIPMVLTIEISQLQFDMVVFVPVVQVCSSIL